MVGYSNCVFIPYLKYLKEDTMQPICLEIPPEIAAQIKLPPKRAQRVLMEEFVLRLYEEGIISAGQGAYLLKMDRLSFERFLAGH